MSTFRVVYRQGYAEEHPPEVVDAVEFICRDPWIIFLDPAGTCFTTRSEAVQRIERVISGPPQTEPRPSIPSDLLLPPRKGWYPE